MDAGYREEFSVAESLIGIVTKNLPKHPVGYFLKSALYELMFFETAKDSAKELFDRWSKETEIKGDSYKKNHTDDPWGYFFTGAIYTIEVFLKAYTGSYLCLLSKVGPALSNLSKAVQIESTACDGHLGLGGYEYFKGMLLFMGSEKEKGIARIKNAIEKGKYTRYFSTIGLANPYIREKKYKDARVVLMPLLENFPDSRTISWPSFTSFIEKGNKDSIIYWGEKLLTLSKDNPYSYNQVQKELKKWE